MSGSRPEAQLVLAALSAAAQVATRRHGQMHEREMAALRHGAMADLVDALIRRRVDAVQDGFAAVLTQYAEQARHYMQQQQQFAERELDATDPLRRLELRSRTNDLDTRLAEIRAEVATIYAHMTEVIRALGGTRLDFAATCRQPLALLSPMGETDDGIGS